MSYITEEIYCYFPKVINNMETHNFKRNENIKNNLIGYVCIKCNCLAVEIFWSGNTSGDGSNSIAITCDEMIIKNIIE